MEFETTVFTMVIPLRCDPADFTGIVHAQGGDRAEPEERRAARFLRCFTPRPLSRTLQLEDSPFLKRGKDRMAARFDLTQVGRELLGIHHNQNCVYLLTKSGLRFQIKQVRLWVFRWGAAFLTVEVCGGADEKSVLDLTAQLCAIQLRAPISYRQALGKGSAETRTFTMRSLIDRFLALQDFVEFRPCPGETFKKASCLFMGIGTPGGDREHAVFLETLRQTRKSCLRCGTGIDEKLVYRPFSYIHWAAGERMLAVIGDLSRADEQGARFLRDRGGLRKTVFENYLLLYLHYLGVYLHTRYLEKECEQIHRGDGDDSQSVIRQLILLGRLPLRDLSSENHINNLFETYLCGSVWDLWRRMEKLGSQDLPELIRNRPCDVFISYRRKGGFYPARLLYTLLEQRQKKVFLDMESLGTGRFDEHIYQVLEQCRVAVVVLTEGCLNRCSDPEDWMRRELQKAVERRKAGQLTIIPVMIDGFEFPKKMPEQIDISRENAVRFTPQSFRGDFEMLCRFLDKM